MFGAEIINSGDYSFEMVPLEWQVPLGRSLVKEGNYLGGIEARINRLPEGQVWTTANLAYAEQLQNFAEEMEESGFRNNTLITFLACAYTHRGYSEGHEDALFGEGQVDMANRVANGNSGIVSLEFSLCTYLENLAYLNGAIEGLSNPGAVLVSLWLTTSDGKVILGTINKVSAGSGQIGVIGGTYDYPPTTLPPEPDEVARSEIEEELGVRKELVKPRLETVLEDKHGRVVLVYTAKLGITESEILELWHASGSEEHGKLLFIADNFPGLLQFSIENLPENFHPPADVMFQRASIKRCIDKEDSERNALAGTSS